MSFASGSALPIMNTPPGSSIRSMGPPVTSLGLTGSGSGLASSGSTATTGSSGLGSGSGSGMSIRSTATTGSSGSGASIGSTPIGLPVSANALAAPTVATYITVATG